MKTYTPLQFHFHAPSEHTVEGKYYDLEVHFVHKNQGATDTGIAESYGAVIGVFFDVQAGGAEENAFIASVLEALATG